MGQIQGALINSISTNLTTLTKHQIYLSGSLDSPINVVLEITGDLPNNRLTILDLGQTKAHLDGNFRGDLSD